MVFQWQRTHDNESWKDIKIKFIREIAIDSSFSKHNLYENTERENPSLNFLGVSIWAWCGKSFLKYRWKQQVCIHIYFSYSSKNVNGIAWSNLMESLDRFCLSKIFRRTLFLRKLPIIQKSEICEKKYFKSRLMYLQ